MRSTRSQDSIAIWIPGTVVFTVACIHPFFPNMKLNFVCLFPAGALVYMSPADLVFLHNCVNCLKQRQIRDADGMSRYASCLHQICQSVCETSFQCPWYSGLRNSQLQCFDVIFEYELHLVVLVSCRGGAGKWPI